MTKKITFSAFGRDSYYHRDKFKRHGLKFSSKAKTWTSNKLSKKDQKELEKIKEKYNNLEQIFNDERQKN